VPGAAVGCGDGMLAELAGSETVALTGCICGA
jgi:hypothetical protein